MQWQLIVKQVENVSDWLFYVGGALKEVADWPGLTVMICSLFRITRAVWINHWNIKF